MLNQNFQRELALFDAKVDSQIAPGKIDASLAMAKYDALFQAASDNVPRAQDFVEATFNPDVLNMPTYTYGEKMEGKEDGELITDANIFEASQDIKTDQLLPNQRRIAAGRKPIAGRILTEAQQIKKDLEEAQLTAIMNYEKIRKKRKEQKKIEQEKNREQEAIRNQIRRAVAPPQKEYNNPFANCY